MLVMLYFASILLTGALSGLLAFYAWRQRDVPGSRAFAGLALGTCLLALAEILSMLSPTPAQALFWWQVRFLPLAVISVFWLVFALEYGGGKGWLSKRLLAGMFAVPAITEVSHWSNSLHGLWVKQEVSFHQNGPFWIADISTRIPGLGYLVHSLYSIILLLAGIGLLLITAWRLRRLSRRQAFVVAGTGFTVFVFTIISAFSLIPRGAFNPITPVIGLSVLVFALAIFRFQFTRAPAAETDLTQSGQSLAVFMFIFVLMATGIVALGYLSYQNYESQSRAQVASQLASIAELKVRGLENWRAEQIGDAQAIRQNPAFAALIARYLEDFSDTQAQAQVWAWLDLLRISYQYEQVFLLDTRGVARISSPATSEPVSARVIQEAAAVLGTGQTTFLDFYRDTAEGPIYLAILAPIYAEPDSRPLGILVLRIDPRVYLYPFIQQWPVPTTSAETLLVRREGTDVLYLNELRFRTGTALNLRIPLENTQVPAVKAALGQEGVVEGVDYRGKPVVAAIRAVPDSPWFLVARIDTAEVYALLRERLWQTAGFLVALIAACGAGLGLIWRQQRVRYLRGQVDATQALRKSEARYRLLSENSADVIWSLNPKTGKFTYVSPSVQKLRGYTPEQVMAQPVAAVLTPASLRLVNDLLAARLPAFIAKGAGSESFVDEVDQPCKDGSIVHTEVTTTYVFNEQGEVEIIGVTRDMTERKRAEEDLRRSQQDTLHANRLLITLSQAAQAMQRARSVEEVYWAIQEQLNQLGYRATSFEFAEDGQHLHIAHFSFQSELKDKAEKITGLSLHTFRFRPRAGSVYERVISNNETVFVADTAQVVADTLPKGLHALARLLADLFGLRQSIFAPLRAGEETIGVLAINGDDLTEVDAPAVTAFAGQAAIARQNARLNEQARQEIAERKRAEEALLRLSARQQALLSAIPDIIMEVDRDKVYTWANQAGIEFFGEDVLGKEAAYYFEGEQNTYEAVQPLFNDDERVIYVESWQRRKDGEKRLLAWWCRVLKDDRGNVTGVLSSARDITERKQEEAQILAAQAELRRLLVEADQARRALLSVVEDQKAAEEEIRKLNAELDQRVRERTAELQQRTLQLEAANKELEAFTYSVSHDLRAPLRAIDGYTHILIEDYQFVLDAEGKRVCNVVRDEASRMSHLIDDLLAFSRLSRADMRIVSIDMAGLAHSAFNEVVPPESRERIDFHVTPLPPAIGDPLLIRQVWVNLLSNAVKFSSKRERAKIEVGNRQAGDESIYWVRDNGAGFDMQYADKLFGVFQRLHSEKEFEGTGVGLAIVQRIIHRHGGRVWAESTLDHGATFYFALPQKGAAS